MRILFWRGEAPRRVACEEGEWGRGRGGSGAQRGQGGGAHARRGTKRGRGKEGGAILKSAALGLQPRSHPADASHHSDPHEGGRGEEGERWTEGGGAET